MLKRSVYISELEAEIDFARRAANDFAEHPEHATFGPLEPGSLLALRWGLCDDCVLVLKLDESFIPTNYMGMVKKE